MDTTMANEGHEPNSGRVEHRETYDGFLSLTKTAIIVVAIALILMAIFLA